MPRVTLGRLGDASIYAVVDRAALARLADGRVQLDGPLATGRRLLRLLSVP